MKTNEVKIDVPEGYEIDKENSTFECIKFKKKEFTPWRYNQKTTSGYSIVCRKISNWSNNFGGKALFATEKQAKSALAMAQISQIMANDERFGGAIINEEWGNTNIAKWVIRRRNNDVFVDWTYYWYFFIAFHTEEQRDLFLKENGDLVREYLMVD